VAGVVRCAWAQILSVSWLCLDVWRHMLAVEYSSVSVEAWPRVPVVVFVSYVVGVVQGVQENPGKSVWAEVDASATSCMMLKRSTIASGESLYKTARLRNETLS
jgi:hypothetical protein